MSSYVVQENGSHVVLESGSGWLLLEFGFTIAVYPDPFQATATPKTQSFLGATAVIKTVNPMAATANWRFAGSP